MKRLILFPLFLLLLVSCNIYAPFQGTLGTQGILEQALKCYQDNDPGCAIEQYNLLPDGALKSRQLCTAYMFRAGMGISQLVSTTQSGGNGMFQALANEVMPWTTTKGSDAAAAVTNCTSYATSQNGGTNEKESVLLKALSIFLDCATKMAKSDVLNQSGAGGQCNNTASLGTSNNNQVDQGDIAPVVGGSLAGSQGMCDDDATSCANNLNNINTDLNNAGLSNFSNIPAGLAGAATSDLARAALRAAVTR